MTAGRNEGLGMVFAGLAASSYAISSVMAGVAYGEGTNPATVVTGRFTFAAIIVLTFLLLSRRALTLPPQSFLLMAGMIVGSLGTATGYMSAIDYIPVSLAVLLFYTFPLLVAVAESLIERRPLSPALLIALLLGFVGLALALGPDFSSLDWRGIAFGLLAAFSSLPLFLCGRQLVLRYDAITVAVQVNLLSLVLAFLFAVLGEGLALPTSDSGWLLLLGCCGFFASAFLLQLYAVRNASAGSAAMVFNAEPLVTILIAWFLLGQALDGLQWVGVILVFAALSLLVKVKG